MDERKESQCNDVVIVDSEHSDPERSQPNRPGRKTVVHPNYKNDTGKSDPELAASENSGTDDDEDFEPTDSGEDGSVRRSKPELCTGKAIHKATSRKRAASTSSKTRPANNSNKSKLTTPTSSLHHI